MGESDALKVEMRGTNLNLEGDLQPTERSKECGKACLASAVLARLGAAGIAQFFLPWLPCIRS